MPATAQRLNLHRTSLYYRLGRIQEHIGHDIGRGEDRLTLHLGPRALQVLDALSAVQPTADR